MITVQASEFDEMNMCVKSHESSFADRDEYKEIDKQKEELTSAYKGFANHLWIEVRSNDKSLYGWTGFDRKCFDIL